MKSILIATTALVATAGVAIADVTVSGLGRFGLVYDGSAGPGVSKTTIDTRMRINIDGSVETDSGVVFGGRIRMQYDDGFAGATLNAANLTASYAGLTLTVGNVGAAYDNSALMYNSEMGFRESSFGDPGGNFYFYDNGPYSNAAGSPSGLNEADRMGINLAYAIGDLSVEASYIDPQQTTKTLPAVNAAEFALTANYKFGQFTVSAATAQNGGGIKNNDLYFVGGEYAASEVTNIGLLYFDNNPDKTITLYGNHKINAITLRGYVARNNAVGNATKTALGLGVDYDLGGATLSGAVERGYAKETRADLGVRFSF